MSASVRTLLLAPRPLRSTLAAAARRSYASIPTKNPKPTEPMEPSREQAMPIGRFYEAILNTPQPIPDVKPEEPASSAKENLEADADATTTKESAKRGRKPKAEPAATATAPSAPTASPAKEPASKSPVSSSAPPSSTTSSSSSQASEPVGEASGASPSAAAPAEAPPVPNPPPTSAEDKAKVIFGSRLAGPAERAERLAKIRSKSTLVAGVLLPPKPEEPDNCCMSGCVNCVWDRFRDDMEDWALANAEVERRLAAESSGGADGGVSRGGDAADSKEVVPPAGPKLEHTAVSMDDDGGGSETNWDVGTAVPRPSGKVAKNFWDEELYKDVPVGIREFMKQEKRLKEKHLREGTSGG